MSETNFAAIRLGLSKRANEDLGIPPRYRRLALENYDGNPHDVALARDAVFRSGGVFLSGACGVGKTHLATALLLDWYASAVETAAASIMPAPRPRARFVASADLTVELAELGKRREVTFFKKYDEFECLLLDDLGAELSNERSRHVFGAMVDRRFRRMKPMIITSNLSLQDLSKLYDDRMASRIAGSCAVIKLTGPDHRVTPIPKQQALAMG
jgi:DNA replication protein DnaC